METEYKPIYKIAGKIQYLRSPATDRNKHYPLQDINRIGCNLLRNKG